LSHSEVLQGLISEIGDTGRAGWKVQFRLKHIKTHVERERQSETVRMSSEISSRERVLVFILLLLPVRQKSYITHSFRYINKRWHCRKLTMISRHGKNDDIPVTCQESEFPVLGQTLAGKLIHSSTKVYLSTWDFSQNKSQILHLPITHLLIQAAALLRSNMLHHHHQKR
jgi:hypothetical protein